MRFEVKLNYFGPINRYDDKLKIKFFIDIEPNNTNYSISLKPNYKLVEITTASGTINLHSMKEISGFLEFLEFGIDTEADFQSMSFNIDGRVFDVELGTDFDNNKVVFISSPDNPAVANDGSAVISINSDDSEYVIKVFSDCILDMWQLPIEELMKDIIGCSDGITSVNPFTNEFSERWGIDNYLCRKEKECDE